MSLQLPESPNLNFLRKQAKELHRSTGAGKLANAQHTLARQYGFASWTKSKEPMKARKQTPREALRTAVCNKDTARVRQLLDNPELRRTIDEPLPDYG